MSLISSLRLSVLPSLSRRLVSSVCVSSISSSTRITANGKKCGHSGVCCCGATSSFISSSSLFNAVTPRFFSSSTALVAPGVGRLHLSKTEALEQLDSEIRELTLPDDAELDTYIGANNYKVDVNEREVVISRSDSKADVTVRFAIMPDTDEMAGMGQDQQQQQEQKSQSEGENQPPKPLKHSFMVQIRTKSSSNNFLHVNCQADEEGRIIIEHLSTDEIACKKLFSNDEKENPNNLDMGMFDANTTKFLNFEDLPDGPAEKIFNLLGDFGIDDRLALFVQQYSYVVRTKMQVEKVRSLADFIAAIP